MRNIAIALFAWYSTVAFAAPAANNGSSIAHTNSAQEGAFSGVGLTDITHRSLQQSFRASAKFT